MSRISNWLWALTIAAGSFFTRYTPAIAEPVCQGTTNNTVELATNPEPPARLLDPNEDGAFNFLDLVSAGAQYDPDEEYDLFALVEISTSLHLAPMGSFNGNNPPLVAQEYWVGNWGGSIDYNHSIAGLMSKFKATYPTASSDNPRELLSMIGDFIREEIPYGDGERGDCRDLGCVLDKKEGQCPELAILESIIAWENGLGNLIVSYLYQVEDTGEKRGHDVIVAYIKADPIDRYLTRAIHDPGGEQPCLFTRGGESISEHMLRFHNQKQESNNSPLTTTGVDFVYYKNMTSDSILR